jgi:hypothetical protein
LDSNIIWAGTDDGLIHITKDGGKNWTNVTPPEITSWSKVSLIDASHFDPMTAYAAVNRIRCDDPRPHIFRTTDGGKTWKEIVTGLANDPINAVREDPIRKGLLFAGSERFVQVSFDNGDHWQSLRLNMPATSIRDLVIKDDDLVVGTHGRSFWILDNITPLRQLTPQANTQKVILYEPQNTYRVRWNMNPDTPLPQEEPAGQNPPDGAIIDYYLSTPSEAILEIFDEEGALVRKFSTQDKPYAIPDVNIPLYWIRPQQILSGAPGHHRFLWDLHYAPLETPVSYPIAAIYQNTAPDATSPWAMPGKYTVKLTVGGQTLSKTFMVKMDPRVKTSTAHLQLQHHISMMCYDGLKKIDNTQKAIGELKKQIAAITPLAKGSTLPTVLKTLDQKISDLDSSTASPNLSRVSRSLSGLMGILIDTDFPPTTQTVSAAKTVQNDFDTLMGKWDELQKSLTDVNAQLKKAKLSLLH